MDKNGVPPTQNQASAQSSGEESWLVRFGKSLFWFICSVKLAVVVIVALTGALITATIMESLYDTPTAQYWVYQSAWFHGILLLLGVEILLVALSRIPWKRHHGPFLMAHAGILILLFGSWLTDQFGLDGSLRIAEGEVGTVVESNYPTLMISDNESHVRSMPIRWIPPTETFKGLEVPDYGLTIDQFITHAEPIYNFVPNEDKSASNAPLPAVKIRLQGGPMRITQDLWLWAGSPNWNEIQAGPSTLILAKTGADQSKEKVGRGPRFVVEPKTNGDLEYRAYSSTGQFKSGVLKSGKINGSAIDPGWKGNVQLTVLEWVPNAQSRVTYKASEVQYGEQAPSSAIHIKTAGGTSDIWLGLGDRAILSSQGKDMGIAYYPKRVVLPFGIRLEKFAVTYYEGSRSPATYASRVSVMDGDKGASDIEISMNEPLKHSGITFYQASYEEAQPRPTVTILSVNRDPGRAYKYIGSLLIVLGSILLFASKYKKAKVTRAVPAPAVAAEVET